jgi:hypothetical protein
VAEADLDLEELEDQEDLVLEVMEELTVVDLVLLHTDQAVAEAVHQME